MEDPRILQKAIYGASRGPPMLYETPKSKPTRRPFKRRKLDPPQPPTEQAIRILKERARVLLINPSQLSPGDLPGDFPPELAFRALAAYALLRTLSVPLRLSPFTPNVFLRALYLPYPNKLMGQVHVALLRILLSQLGYTYKPRGRNMHKRRSVDNLRWPLLGGDNLIYLDGISWPLFYDDYCHLTADRLWASYHDSELHLDFRCHGLQPVDIEEFRFDYVALDDDDDDDDDQDENGEEDEETETSDDEKLAKGTDKTSHRRKQPLESRLKSRQSGHFARTKIVYGSDSDSEFGFIKERDDGYRPSSRPRGRKRRAQTQTLEVTIPSSKVKDVEVPVRAGLHASTPTEKWEELSPPPTNGNCMLTLQANLKQELNNLPQKTLFSEIKRFQHASSTSQDAVENNESQPKADTEHASPQTTLMSSTKVKDNVEQPLAISSESPENIKDKPQFFRLENGEVQPKWPQATSNFDGTATDASTAHFKNNSPYRVTPDDEGFLNRSASAPKLLNRRKLPIMTSKETRMATFTSTRPRLKLPMSSSTKRPAEISIAQPSAAKKLMTKQTSAQYQHELHALHVEEASKCQHQNHKVQSRQIVTHADSVGDAKSINIYTLAQMKQQQQIEQQKSPPEHLAYSYTNILPQAKQTKTRKKAIEVEDDIAKCLRDFLAGANMESPVASDERKDTNIATDSSDDFQHRVNQQQWIHFEPLKKLRHGVPYHRITPEEKVVILEFLIDQLLSMDSFATEFTKRRTVEDSYSNLFGAWPTDTELENLENNDECGVCHGEGELLCCDGCVASYHRECLDMASGQQPPDGKWLCPECRLVDPSLFGPLRGGTKASLDWFTLQDVESSIREEADPLICRDSQLSLQTRVMLSEQHDDSWLSMHSRGLSSPPPARSPSTLSQNINDRSTTPAIQPTASDFSTTATTIPTMLQRQNFLVVHGFVFCRSSDRAAEATQLLPRSTVLAILNQLHPSVRKAWPIAQIPLNDESSGVHFSTTRQYLLPIESYDPNCYKSRYARAPTNIIMQSSGGIHAPKLSYSDFENECMQITTQKISDILVRDFSLDSLLCKSLRSERLLFDPYQHFKGSMIRMETTLRRACLLNEFWEAGTDRSRQEKWLRCVGRAKSVNRLCRLLLKLVDSVHPRAFGEGWFHNPLLKTNEILVDSGKHFEDLPADWCELQESRKRLWEKIPPESILRLCEKEKSSLEGFVQGIREHISQPLLISRSKRKQTRTIVTTSPGAGQSRIKNETDLLTLESTTAELKPTCLSNAMSIDKATDSAILGTKDDSSNDQQPVAHNNDPPNGSHIPNTFINVNAISSSSELDKCAAVDTRERSNDAEGQTICFDKERLESHGLNDLGELSVVPDEAEDKKNRNDENSNKKKKRSEVIVSTSRRTRRSAGRFANNADERETPGHTDCPTFEPIVKRISVSTADSTEAFIEECKLKKVAQIEKLVKGGFQRQMEWPICGRLPFAPMGNLPPNEMKRLGRNGGVVKAPYIAYQTSHEVGQVCFAHIWRRQTKQCHSFEELSLQLRVLESFLDKPTIQSCENVVRRGKNQLQKIVKITQRDPSNGIVEHFVLSKTKMRGCWISSEHMEVSGLILEAFNRRQNQLERRQAYLQEKQREERIRKEREATVIMNQQVALEKAAAERKIKAEIDAKARAMIKADNEAAMKDEVDANTKSKIKADIEAKALTERHLLNLSTNSAPMLPKESFQMANVQHEIKTWNEKSKSILMQHQLDLAELTRSCINMGIYPVPASRINAMRKTTITRLQHAATTLRNLNLITMEDSHFSEMIISCEKMALQVISSQSVSASVDQASQTSTNSKVDQVEPVNSRLHNHEMQSYMQNQNPRRAPAPPRNSNEQMTGHELAFNVTTNSSMTGHSFHPDQQGGSTSGEKNYHAPNLASILEGDQYQDQPRHLAHGITSQSSRKGNNNSPSSYSPKTGESEPSKQAFYGRDNPTPTQNGNMYVHGTLQPFNQQSAPGVNFADLFFGGQQSQTYQIQRPQQYAAQHVSHSLNSQFGYPSSIPQPFSHEQQQGVGPTTLQSQPMQHPTVSQNLVQSLGTSPGVQQPMYHHQNPFQQFQQPGQQSVQALQMELQRLQRLRHLQQLQQQNSQYQGPSPSNPYW